MSYEDAVKKPNSPLEESVLMMEKLRQVAAEEYEHACTNLNMAKKRHDQATAERERIEAACEVLTPQSVPMDAPRRPSDDWGH